MTGTRFGAVHDRQTHLVARLRRGSREILRFDDRNELNRGRIKFAPQKAVDNERTRALPRYTQVSVLKRMPCLRSRLAAAITYRRSAHRLC